MNESAATLLVMSLYGLTVAVWLLPRLAGTLRELWRQYASRSKAEAAVIAALVLCAVYVGGTKPTNTESQAQSGGVTNTVVIAEPSEEEQAAIGGGVQMSLLEGGETARLTSNQYAAGFALVRVLTNASPWMAVPSNAVLHAPWGRYGLAEDTFWLPATNWAFTFGTNAVEGAHVSSSGTLSFDEPKGSPRAAGMPDGSAVDFLAPLQGWLGTVPPGGRFWHAPTASNSVLMTWQDLYAGRDTNSPVTFQGELFENGDFVYRYAFTNVLALTNFVVGAQRGGGGETYALNDTNRLVNGLELRWRAFGMLDPGVDDHDGDGLSTYDEVMTYDTDPSMKDTDLDGLGDYAEAQPGGTDPLTRDFDGDGIPDGGDPNPLSADTADLDGDGLPDAWEIHWFGGTNVTDSAGADSNGDGFGDRVNLLAGANPVFAACAVTTSRGPHLFTWTGVPSATNYSVTVSCGGTSVWACVTNVCAMAVMGDFTSAEHTLTVTAARTNGPALVAVCGFRQPSQPNLTVWRIADPFAVAPPSDNAAVLDRTFRIGRVRQWQQYYVSANHDSAAPWSLDGMRLEWRDSTGAAGTNSASPAGDSLALAVGPDADTLTVRLVTTRGDGLARSPKTFNLIGWSPAVTFGTNATVIAADGERALVLVTGQDGLPTGVGFTVDAAGRPHNAPLTDAEKDSLRQPLGSEMPGVQLTYDASGLPSAGALTAAASGSYALSVPGGGVASAADPSGGGGGSQPRPDDWPGAGPDVAYLLCPVVAHVQGDDAGRRWTCGDEDYPFDRECLREGFDNGGCVFDDDPVEDPRPAGFEVSLGDFVPDGAFTIEIGEDEYQETPAFYAWDGDEQQKGVSVKYGGTAVWGEDVRRQPESRESACWGSVWFGECGGCGEASGGCPDGDCSVGEGDSLGSVRFRLPLGRTGYRTLAGAVWFDMESVQPVTPSLFRAAFDPDTIVRRDAGGALTGVVCVASGGRDIRIDAVAGGVRVSVRDTGNEVEDRSWTITNATGDVVAFIKRDGAGNVLRSVSYSRPGGTWRRTDSATGVYETSYRTGNVTNGSEYVETIARDASSLALSGRNSWRTLVGTGAAAVVREIRSGELEGSSPFDGWRYTYMTYWADSLNSLVNGSPKFRYSDGGAWEYRACDDQGRETLRVEVLDGSAHPPFANDSAPFAFSPSGSYPALTALVAVTSYAPVLDDGSHLDDSRKARQVSRYAVRGGSPVLISREWHVYTHGASGGLPTVTRRSVRAASQAAAAGSDGNAVSVSVSVADDVSVPPLMRGRPLSEERADGTLLTWEYVQAGGVLTVTSRRGTVANPSGVANASTYEVETFDDTFCRALSRETRLYAGGGTGPLLSSEARGYDARGRLLGVSYSDGTFESNVWGCCTLDARIARDGARTEYASVPGDNHRTVTSQTSLADLPGADGYPALESYTDGAGRQTGSVSRVYAGGNPHNGYTPLVTRTSYPDGTRYRSVTVDAFGGAVTSRNYLGENFEADETVSGGVTACTVRVSGGMTTKEKLWSDPVSGQAKWFRTRTETAWEGAGREIETVSNSRDGGVWSAGSVAVRDMLGREIAVSVAGFNGALLVTSNAYDSAGRKIRALSHDGSGEFYAYGALGARAGVIRVGAGQALAFDPDAFTLPAVIALDAYVVEETPSWKEEGDLDLSAHGVPTAWWDCAASVQHVPGLGAVTASVRRVQLTGLSAACVARTVTTDSDGVSEIVSEALDTASAIKTVTRVNVATGAFDAQALLAGVEVARTNSLGSSSAYTFDGFARRTSEESRAGARVLRGMTGYHDDGSMALHSDVSGTTTNVTTYSARQYLESPEGAYSVIMTDALGGQTVRFYHPSSGGDPYRVEGAVYPTATARDTDGRQSELRTWRDESGQPDITHWHYDVSTGLVTNKVYADGKGPVYAYTADGRLAMRAWARSVTSEYSRVELSDGSVTVTDHAGSTPDVTNRYDLAGRLVSVADGAGNRTLSYDAKGRLTAETNSLAAISRHYDALGRDAGYDLDLPGFAANTFSVRYGYDGHGRLDRAASALGSVTNVFVYSFLPGTSLVTSMTNSAGVGWSRTYEPNRNLIVAVSNFWGTSAVSSFVYENDALGRRTLRVDAASALSATNAFAYNQRSEVTNAAMGATSYSYAYDDIGNRRLALSNAVACTYSANELNQYYGVTNAGAWLPVTYDSDGNMTRLGGRYYAWDAENNMRRSGPLVNSNGNVRVDNAYDYKSRRVSKTVSVLTGYIPFTGIGQPFSPGEWVPSNTTHYVWDGWNIAAEIQIDCGEGTTNVHYYTWGLDLSGSIQGAGGVGGLLDEVRDSGTFFPCGDANGNVSEYVDATGAVRGHFEYSAFGEVAAQSGDLSDTFTHRFSTKPFDEETGISKYQQRDYIPPLGRWASRDPIGEDDTVNLNLFLLNNSVSTCDYLGFASWPWNVVENKRQPAITNGTEITGGGTYKTKWDVMPTKHRAWFLSSCCTISVKADGEVSFWWSVAPPRGRLNLTPLQHETSHVRQFRQQWVALENDITSLIAGKMKCKKAACLFDVVENLRLARLNLAYAIGKEFDVRNGQRTEDERAEYQRKADEYFQKAIRKRLDCDAL